MEYDPKELAKIRRIAATMNVEGMPLTERAYNNLLRIARGEATTEEIRKELIERYKKDGSEILLSKD